MKIVGGYRREYRLSRIKNKEFINEINKKFDEIRAYDHHTYIHIVDEKIPFWRWNKRYIISISNGCDDGYIYKIRVWKNGYLEIAKKISGLLGIDNIVLEYTEDIEG